MTPYYADTSVTLYEADALDVLAFLPDSSVNLIATDPPYFGVKDEEWDNVWSSDAEYLAWIGALCEEWRRVLKPNGSLYVFASPEMAHGVEGVIRQYFRLLSNIRWRKPPYSTKAEMFRKEDLREPFPASETILFAEQKGSYDIAEGVARYDVACIALKRRLFGDPIREAMIATETSTHELTEAAGAFRSHNHGGAASNWLLGYNCPTAEQYAKIRRFLNSRNGKADYLRREYEDLRREYEDLRRPFNATADAPYTDVWDFPTVNVYPGKHPCEKPLAMMEHIVRTSSRPGDVVLDTFVGSGTTAEAARNMGRRAIAADNSPHWCRWTAERCSQAVMELGA